MGSESWEVKQNNFTVPWQILHVLIKTGWASQMCTIRTGLITTIIFSLGRPMKHKQFLRKTSVSVLFCNMIFPWTKMYFCIHFSPWLWASAFVLIYSGWTAKIVLCWCCGKDGASPGNVPWERCGGEGKALWGAPALGQWGGEGASKTDETGTVGGPCPHTHTKRAYTGLVTGRQGYASQDSWQGWNIVSCHD